MFSINFYLYRLLQVNSFEEIYCINEHRGLIYSINWSLDDTLLLTASADNTVIIWNFATNRFLQVHFKITYNNNN